MFLTIKQLSAWLNVKPSTLYAWVAHNRIPHVKMCGLIRFDKDRITEWITALESRHLQLPSQQSPKDGEENLDALIATAKRQTYTAACGRPDQDRATRKERNHGTV